MDEQIIQPAINESPEVSPVVLPDENLTLPERVARLEEELTNN